MNADVRMKKLQPEPVERRPEVVRRDATSGSVLERPEGDDATDEPHDEGRGDRWVDEDGEEVPPSDIEGYAVRGGEEQPVAEYEPTIGEGRTLEANRWIPVAEVDEYLVEETYEIWSEDGADIAQLYELAEHIREVDQAPVVPVVPDPSYHRDWGIILPTFFDGTFSLVLRVTCQKVAPEQRMPMGNDDREEIEVDDQGAMLERESPIG